MTGNSKWRYLQEIAKPYALDILEELQKKPMAVLRNTRQFTLSGSRCIRDIFLTGTQLLIKDTILS